MPTYQPTDPETGGQSVATIISEELSPNDVLNPEVLAWLATQMGDTTLAGLCNTGVRGLNISLRAAGPADGVNPVEVARALFTMLTELEIIASSEASPAAGAPAGPVQVEVKLPENPAAMSLGDLLGLLVTHPERYAELAPLINANAMVVAAVSKTPNWVVPGDGGIDVGATMKYLTQLGKEFSVPQRMVSDGRRPVTLPRAFKQDERELIHPFTLLPVTGPDALGFDWGTLGDELHRAVIWAQATKHPAWPGTVDPFTHSTELFQTPLPARWQQILEDYRAACEDNGGDVIPSRYYTADLLALVREAQAGGAPFAGAAGKAAPRDDAWYLEQLEDIAEAPVNVRGSSVSKGHAVVKSISVRGGSCSLNSIVLGGVYVIGGSLSGVVYLPRGEGATVQGGSNSATVYNRSPQKLYELAVQWGLIEV